MSPRLVIDDAELIVEVLDARPGDVIVLRAPHDSDLTNEQAQRAMRDLEHITGARVFVLAQDVDISVIHKEDLS